METPGILWPWMPEGMDDLPYVQRDDESDLYADDIAAARALAAITGTRVMFVMDDHAGVDGDTGETIPVPVGEELSHLRPFVFAFEDSSPEDGDFDKWLRERAERFGPRKARYDEATGVAQIEDDEVKERATCSGCLARTYRDEECICEDGGDAENYDEIKED